MRVKDCMGERELVQATPDTNLNEIAKLMDTNHIGCIPICNEQKVVGLVTDRDIVIRAISANMDCNNTKVSDIMNTNIVKTTPDTSIEDALDVMEKNKIRRLPVIEDNKLIGMLSIGDLANNLSEDDVGYTLSCICDDE